jgi:large subunit ribosomal protein L10
MTREEKYDVVEKLTEKLKNTEYFYITDAGGMTVAETNAFRRLCFEKGIGYQVVKNTLIKKALANLNAENTSANFQAFDDKKVLKGFSGILFSNSSANAPAKLLKEFYKKHKKKNPQPALKGASIRFDLYTGQESLDSLEAIKSQKEMVGDIILALQSSGSKLAGILKTLSEKDGE